jgi:hypothetical protein
MNRSTEYINPSNVQCSFPSPYDQIRGPVGCTVPAAATYIAQSTPRSNDLFPHGIYSRASPTPYSYAPLPSSLRLLLRSLGRRAIATRHAHDKYPVEHQHLNQLISDQHIHQEQRTFTEAPLSAINLVRLAIPPGRSDTVTVNRTSL